MSNLYDSNYRVIFIPVVLLLCQHKRAILVTQPSLSPLCNSLLGLLSNFDITPFRRHFANCRLLPSNTVHLIETEEAQERMLSLRSVWNKFAVGKKRAIVENNKSEECGDVSHVPVGELDHKEGWVLKNWCFQTVVLEKTLESPLDCKKIKPGNPKGNQFWIFIGGTDAKAETSVLWAPDAKSWLIGKDPDAGKDWGQEEKGTTEDEMVGWHHWLNGCEFEQTLGGGGQWSLACCSPWGCKDSGTAKQLNRCPLDHFFRDGSFIN